jgi:hypothetical protein
VSAREIAVKKYVVTLSTEERERLQTLIRSGRHSARKLMRARILLKADASRAGDAWSDSQIADGLDTSLVTVARIRQQLVEEGVDGILTPFVAAMEDVIEVYHRPHDPDRPVGLRGRDIEATHRRDPYADPGQAGATETGRLRI